MRFIALLCLLLNFALQAEEAPEAVLDKLHEYAASADWDKYFTLYTEDALFLGTDAGERWTMADFASYARPTQGWRYLPIQRHLLRHGDIIAFDELLDSPAYGQSRGSGVLVKTAGGWRILQYHLSFPIPNDIAKEITGRIRAAAGKGSGAH
ncbi:nuclear transport factor 2 family protein [Shewanella sedimentimangrovi]|uniref:Nuclear transport factor 2 family protein n=1 Tax=Shewanella sedimentimangrovi TaxID=2814293 RepID=A0ABX7QYW1_9GAMM|nr:nuclear transport factor 2 family protein [Shewanella sedimentimangrovi]QSX36160.1 nuclear transport factor 2 family protein [Shewanella sedimentimangrovi]